MKKVFCLFPLFLFLVSCGNAPAAGNTAPAVGELFDGTVNDYDGVTMAVVEGPVYPGAVTVEVLNTTETQINSGNEADFGLQMERDGQWYWLERDDYVNTLEALTYAKDEPRELTFAWESTYGSLEPGRYRVTKWFFEYKESGKGPDFLLASEFTWE